MPWVTDVYISDVDGGKLGDYHLTKDLIYEDDEGRLWVTPEGFSGDLSSFPWFVRIMLPKSLLAKSPWPHDFGYRVQPTKKQYLSMLKKSIGNNLELTKLFSAIEGGQIERKTWDKIYLQGAIDEGMNPVLAKTLYKGLRVGGWVAWRSNARKKKKSKMAEEL